MEQEEWKEKVSKAILKVAQGCAVAEIVEEYVEVDGEMKLTKRKKTKKEIPPDLKALQLLLEERSENGVQGMSDEELCVEKERLLKLLANSQKEEPTQKRGRPMKKARKKKGE